MNFKVVLVFFMFCFLGLHTVCAQKRGLAVRLANTLDVIGGVDFGSRLVTLADDASDNEALLNRENNESLKFNYRIGLNYYQGLNGNWMFKTGIRLSNPGFSTNLIEEYDVNGNLNDVFKQGSKFGTKYVYNYQLIEIPLGLKHVFSRSWCESFVEFGLAPNFYTGTIVVKTPFEQRTERIRVIESIKPFNLFAFFGIGGDVNFSDNYSFFTELIFRYQIDYLRESQVNERLVGVGFEAGVKRIF